ncbi:hypothetical protein KY289_036556 [Solanum tuberosum]|nr:hypothetical protein KY289_036556 [Solanum tuberosum]
MARDGDLSPIHRRLMESSAQRGKNQPSLQLQVKTRSNRDRLEEEPQELEQYKKKLGMENAYCNCASKIWVLWEDDWKGEVFRDSGQHLTVKISKSNVEILITAVYARCDALERLELWEELEQLVEDNTLLWIVGGDFNVILNEEEK